MLGDEDLLDYFPRYLQHIRAYQIGVSVYEEYERYVLRDLPLDYLNAEGLVGMSLFELERVRESILYDLEQQRIYLQQAITRCAVGLDNSLSGDIRYIDVPQLQQGISYNITPRNLPLGVFSIDCNVSIKVNLFSGIAKDETLRFSSILFALTFFSQVVHVTNLCLDDSQSEVTDGTPDVILDKYRSSRMEAILRQNDCFPFQDGMQCFTKIKGVLSTANTRVCPILMPLMMLYVEKEDYQLGCKEWFYAARDTSRERQAWVMFKPQFFLALEWMLRYKNFFLEILCPTGWSLQKVLYLRDRCYLEFNRLDAEIMGLTIEKTRVINL